jgi:hypothetical protein
MRFMQFMILDADQADYGDPDVEAVKQMTAYNEQLSRAGVLLALDGLQAPTQGVRITRSADGGRAVTEGPNPDAREIVGGYWIIDVKSRAEAIEWAKRCPLRPGESLELRPVYGDADMPDDVREAARFSPGPSDQTAVR